ncbi:hypothetical protein J8273_3147 [Carpediemonas membranifera]|uniref:Uncharacterized protein n=1 Tax=Carpediemonas membranifera TaxID=201153 RepID=A0A8J6B6Y7_9EUKA|nr:hypothetical protein J8273_3147 [Carpediemonas membranifera]|eukprot:KAG9395569.1 hypothetical protein J8273_3147 [Carpediemonas membranifera]
MDVHITLPKCEETGYEAIRKFQHDFRLAKTVHPALKAFLCLSLQVTDELRFRFDVEPESMSDDVIFSHLFQLSRPLDATLALQALQRLSFPSGTDRDFIHTVNSLTSSQVFVT